MRRDQLVKKYYLLWNAADMLLHEIGGDADYRDEISILENIEEFAMDMVANEAGFEFQEYGIKAAVKLVEHSDEAPEPVAAMEPLK